MICDLSRQQCNSICNTHSLSSKIGSTASQYGVNKFFRVIVIAAISFRRKAVEQCWLLNLECNIHSHSGQSTDLIAKVNASFYTC